MKVTEKHIKTGLFIIFMVFITLPMIETIIPIFKPKSLKGYVAEPEKAEFSLSNWFSNDFQSKEDEYLKNKFGFRPNYIRVYNQWNYNLYDKISGWGIKRGKEGVLYEKWYIETYLGQDFIGEDSIQKQVFKLQTISEELKKQDKHLVILLAPGKGSFYSEYFPEKYDTIEKTTSNYERFSYHLTNSEIPTIDASKWFGEMKTTVHPEHKLFSKSGTHWSKYAEYLVTDSLLKYFAAFEGVQFPDLVLNNLEYSTRPRDTDKDIAEAMNLMFNSRDYRLTYPLFHRENEEKNTTKVLTIADSFYWGIFNYGVSRDYFADGEFWYYYEERYPAHFEGEALVKNVNLEETIKDYKIIMIVCAESNLNRLGYGFIDTYYDLIKSKER